MYDKSENICDLVNEGYYEQIKSKVDSMEPITFGNQVNILLITDKMDGIAKGLKLYLEKSVDITVDLVMDDPDHALKIVQEKPIDFLFIVTPLEAMSAVLHVANTFNRYNRYSITVIYGVLDKDIEVKNNKYGVVCLYNIVAPIEGLISYMRNAYDELTILMHKENSPNTTRQQIRFKAIKALGESTEQPREALDNILRKFLRWLGLKI